MPEKSNHSPRISFSHDFRHFDSIPIEQCPEIAKSPLKSSSHNFDFSIPGSGISGESSWSAEEFFYDGKILPKEIKNQTETRNYSLDQKRTEIDKTGLHKPETNQIRYVKPVVEIEEIGGQKDEVKLPLLRNNSTGSNLEQKQLEVSSSSSSTNGCFEKPPLKKNHGGYSYRGNGGEIRVNSFLDMVPSGNMFGLGSINFGSGSNKNKWRSMFFSW